MAYAARLNDPIGHSPTMSWLLGGLLAAAAIAVTAVAIVGTGGLAAVAIVGGAAAAGAGLGEVMSTMSWAPKEEVGNITATGSSNVFTNGLRAIRAHLDTAKCDKHTDTEKVATGSGTVFINSMPAARVDDKTTCSAVITKGSANVNIGGPTVQTDPINPENLVPTWVHVSLFVVGAGAAFVLAAPIVAIGGIAGGILGGVGGDWLGGKVFGEGSDGQKWSMLGGSLLGGWLGVKGAKPWAPPPKPAAPPPPSVKPPSAPPPAASPPPPKSVISPAMEEKILFGQRGTNSQGNPNNRLTGAHSGDISNDHPEFAVEVLSENPDGTRNVKLIKGFSDGNISRMKSSTLFPEGWSRQQTMNAVQQVADSPPLALRPSDNATLHQGIVNGVEIEVIKVGDNVTAGYPTGRAGFQTINYFLTGQN
jgi:uncharacterized Zn-binding protein involved in type VI secretion